MAKYRVAVIGCRGVGVRHASGVVGLDRAELVAACDLSRETLEAFAGQWKEPGLKLYTSHREMLEREKPDVVTVATSDHRHADLVVDAAEAGARGIFCEKPMATSLADADRMVAAAERNGTVLSIDHTRRWMSLWRYVKEEVLDGGAIGEVQNVIGTLNGPRAMLFRNGTHLIDAMCYFAASDPTWVFAELEEGFEHFTEYRGDGGHDPKSEPSAHGYVRFANGVRGVYVGGPKTTPDPKFRVEVAGATGRVVVDEKATLTRDGKTETIQAPVWPVEGIPAGVQELVRVLDGEGEPVSPGREALKVVEIMVGFLESHRRGNVRVDLPMPRE